MATSTGTATTRIDPRTIKPALLVLAFALLLSVVFPLINSEADYQHQTQNGEVVQLVDGITLVPSAGWNLASGAVVGETRGSIGNTNTTELVNGSIEFNVQAAPFAGTPSALLRRVNKISADLGRARKATRHYAVTTHQGRKGVAEDYIRVNRQGSVVAFAFKVPGQSSREGVEVVVSGAKGQMSRERDHIVAMVRSIRVKP